MKATPLEFRFRFFILAVIYLLGFVAPWDEWLHLDSIRTWQLIASWPTRASWLNFNTATIVVLLLGILCALAGATLRTWATAYLGPSIVQDKAMHGEGVVAAEPYLAYRAKVPSLFPAITPTVSASALQSNWPTAFLGEIYMWGVVITFAFFGWRYNSMLLIKGVLISLGVSLIVRAFLPKR